MKTIPLLGAATLLACMGVTAIAGPAPWFKWRSKADGKQFCAQTSLGHGWEKASGPFKNSHCTKLVNNRQTVIPGDSKHVVRSIHSN